MPRRSALLRNRLLTPVSHDEELFWLDDGHPNLKGHRPAGLWIGRHLLKQSFLEVPDRDKRLSDVERLLSAPVDLELVSHAGASDLPFGYR